MNKVALGDDFFKADRYPTATFTADSITFNGDKPATVPGQLTMAGVTKPVTLHVVSFISIQGPFLNRELCGPDVPAEFDRRKFGMTRDIVASDPNVRLFIQVEAVKGDALPQMGPPPGGAPPGGGPPPGFPPGGPPAGAGPPGPQP